MAETPSQFENRKQDHLRLALDPSSQTTPSSQWDRLKLQHEALPDLNFEDIQIKTDFWGHQAKAPLFISSMTAGHLGGIELNQRLAKFAEKRGWAMGVGSQRRELSESSMSREWAEVRKKAPNSILFGNLGLAQVIETSVSQVQGLVDNLGAVALIVHLNPLQECLQPEGTPQFRGGAEKIAKLCSDLKVPVIVKEVGCGMGSATVERLSKLGVAAVDVAGLGGTHWGRIEGARASAQSVQHKAAVIFENWGHSTLECLLELQSLSVSCQIWASGGVRSGLDAAKLLCLGAQKVGMAQPILKAALESEASLDRFMEQIEYELRVAMFCTGSANLQDLASGRKWTWT